MATMPEPLAGPASAALPVDNAAGSRSPTTPHKRLRLDMAGAAAAGPAGAAGSASSAAADVNGKGKAKVEPVTPSRPEAQTPHQNDDMYGEPPLSTHMKKKRSPKVTPSALLDKNGKGLRQFSLRVSKKVEEKGCTTYNEVAEELVREMQSEGSSEEYDQKNIRRRVYDALNVLMAMDIIRKDKKEIRWVGLPTSSLQELRELDRERKERLHAINVKKAHLQELLLHRITLYNLIKRNAEAEQLANHTPPSPESIINLPFILVRTNQDTFIECEMTPERNEYHFSLTAPFEIHDDIEVLRRMGLNQITPAEIDAMIPPAMRPFLPDYVQLTPENANVPVVYEPQPPAPVLTTPASSPMRGPFSSPSTSAFAPSSPHGGIPSSSPVRSPLKPS